MKPISGLPQRSLLFSSLTTLKAYVLQHKNADVGTWRSRNIRDNVNNAEGVFGQTSR
ncbi:hypothetical protein [Paenibacillus mendelii]|uniref:Uncharacterized protein n=1 Tax=Paenibacillus mendelii TaxID=206163 RepID=A0ABV6J676_9BACL|nr:hypothetical protein [Paenibacillus mendelii]MCQ6561245.1 hypothetical protein [Paenibacillus mendelii]